MLNKTPSCTRIEILETQGLKHNVVVIFGSVNGDIFSLKKLIEVHRYADSCGIAQLIESFSPQGIIEVPVKDIIASSQPRVTFDRQLLEKLARSIETHGQLVPIILIPLPDGKLARLHEFK